jgi:AcrR family transcriptional regulator
VARQRLSEELVVERARRIADERGFESVSLSAVAADLGVATSALYNHCAGLDGLHHQIAVEATNQLVQALRTAAIGTQGDVALLAMAVAYRGFATEHPGQFASTLRPPMIEDDRLSAANRCIVDTFVLVYAAMGFESDRCEFAAHSTHSAIHGFLALEHLSNEPASDSNFDYLIATLRRGLVENSPSSADS